MLHGLAEQGNAPKFLKKVNKRGIPVNAVLLSSAVTALCVLINYIMPSKAFELLMMLVVSALVINWLMISITHLKFRKVMLSTGEQTAFNSLFAPWSNYLTIAFVFFILIVMSFTPDMRIAVVMIPVWLVFLGFMYMAKYRKKAAIMHEVGISR